MAIELIRITDDLRSVLKLTDYQLNDYQKCLEIIEWLGKKEPVPEKVRKSVIKTLESTFAEAFSEYLRKIDLGISGAWVYLQPDDQTVDVYCQGFKIIPGRENVLDGFEPRLKFFINPKNSSEIEVACQLKEEGAYLLSYLVKPTLFHYLPGQNNGFDLPLVKMIDRESLTIASIEQISRFLEDMKTVAQFLGEGRLKQLEEAEEAFTSVSPELKEAAKGIYALTYLKILGREI